MAGYLGAQLAETYVPGKQLARGPRFALFEQSVALGQSPAVAAGQRFKCRAAALQQFIKIIAPLFPARGPTAVGG